MADVSLFGGAEGGFYGRVGNPAPEWYDLAVFCAKASTRLTREVFGVGCAMKRDIASRFDYGSALSLTS